MATFFKFARNPATYALALAFTLAACTPRNNLQNGTGYGANGLNDAMGYNGYANAAPGTLQDFTVNVGDRIFFSLDSSSIREDAQQTLGLQARWLARYPQYKIIIEGHADERGTREYNIALGQRRAVAARNYLVSLGVDPARIRVISYGKERPVALCDNISCWNQNRRAVTVIDTQG